jgi:sialidase-1
MIEMKFKTFFLMVMALLMPSISMFADGPAITSVPFNKADLKQGQYRIPSLVRIDSKTLIAFCDLRAGGSDVGATDGHNSIVAKKSDDNGTSWGEQVTILDATRESDSNFKYGDAATVYDPIEKRILLMCCGGTVAYGKSTTKNPIRTYMASIDPDHLSAVTPTDVTDKIYGLFKSTSLTRLFPTSGEMCRSKYIKAGSHNRIYLALATNIDAKVIYTDDFGKTWNVLGGASTQTMYHANNYTSDETKCVELPDKSVWITARFNGEGRSRGFNVFTYSDDNYTSGSWGPLNGTNCEATPSSSNGNFRMSASRCNASLVIVPAQRTSDNANVYVALHSIPYGEWGTNPTLKVKTYTDRKDLGINWKVLKDRNDFTTMNGQDVKAKNAKNATVDVNASHKLLSGWSNYQLNSDYSAYSTLLDNGIDGVDLLFEHTTETGNYNIAYQHLSLSTITNGAYTYDKSLDHGAYMNVNVVPLVGSVYLIKARYKDGKGNITEEYLYSNFTSITKNGVTSNDEAQLTAKSCKGTDIPDPTYYWTLSQDDTQSSPYFSSFNGDGYMGWGAGGTDYYTHTAANTTICSPFYKHAFSIDGFNHKAELIDGATDVTASDVDGYSMKYLHTSYNKDRFMAVKSDGTAVNWVLNTGSSLTTKSGNWTTDLIFVKVQPSDKDSYGFFNAPTFSQTGYPITFARSEDDCDAYQQAVKSGKQSSFDFNYYATLRAPFALYVPDGVKVYKLENVDPKNSTVGLDEYTDLSKNGEKTIIPRETPVIMQVAGTRGNGNTSVIKYFELAPGHPFTEPDGNGTNPVTKLNGTLGREVLSHDIYDIDNGNKEGYVYYLLGKVNGYVALYRLGLNKKGEFAVAHNKAYFKFKKSGTSAAKASFSMFVQDSGTTGIRDIRQNISVANGKVYDMNGRFVGYSLDGLPHGLYIQNGKKVVK